MRNPFAQEMAENGNMGTKAFSSEKRAADSLRRQIEDEENGDDPLYELRHDCRALVKRYFKDIVEWVTDCGVDDIALIDCRQASGRVDVVVYYFNGDNASRTFGG